MSRNADALSPDAPPPGSPGRDAPDTGPAMPDNRGSSMVRGDRPAPALRPPAEMRREQDRSAFNRAWAKEQMDWAMRHRDRLHQQGLLGKARERSHGPRPEF